MYLCFILIPVIALLIWLFFVCIKTGRIDKKKSCWLLALGVIVCFVLYSLYCPYAKTVIPAIIFISLIAYIVMMLKV
ncbi:hypothetical protein AMJ47_03320 [Parcubacteria bacterium DG_72]|nr:MAG: hypothetical protein AMJ47_03320 [Parcubacteria bacterium DG_72]